MDVPDLWKLRFVLKSCIRPIHHLGSLTVGEGLESYPRIPIFLFALVPTKRAFRSSTNSA